MDSLVLLIVIGVCAAFTLASGCAVDRPAWVRAVLWLLAAIAVIVAAGRLGWAVAGWLPADSAVNSYDFQVFYEAGQAVRRWAPLYDRGGYRRDPGAVVVYRHAPIGAVLFVPWTFLPFSVARNLWRLLNLAVYLATLPVLLWQLRVGWRSPLALGLAALWLASTPSRDSLALGQWDGLFMALSVGALILLTRRGERDWAAGALLALPIALKFYPALILLAPLLARRWRVIAGCATAGAALTVAGALAAGPENTRVFFTQVLPAVGGGTLYAENQTLYAFIGRLLASDLAGNGVTARYPIALTRALANALGFLILLLTALVLRTRTNDPLGFAMRFTLPIPAALLIIPTAWAHYATWALLPLAVLAAVLARDGAPRPIFALFAVAALLIPFGSEREVWGPGAHDGLVRLLLTYKVYGLLALWAGGAFAVWRTRAARPVAGKDAAPRPGSTVLFLRE